MLPAVDYGVTARVGSWFPAGPALSRTEIAEVYSGLKAAAEASVAPVAEVTQLTSASGPMHVIDRPTWVRLNGDMARSMLAEASAAGASEGARARLQGIVTGAELGIALGVLSTRILGQYLPFGDEPRLVLVAPNVAKMERSLGVDHDDFRLWVCLHEQTHRLQFAHAPWLRGYLIERLSGLLESAFAEGRNTPALDSVTGTMALLEGYADVMMDRVGPQVVPTVAAIRERFQAKRDKRGWKLLNKAIGMDLKLAQYRDGAAFCRHVIDAVGVPGLNAVYDEPDHLPTVTEIKNPARWVKRVHD